MIGNHAMRAGPEPLRKELFHSAVTRSGLATAASHSYSVPYRAVARLRSHFANAVFALRGTSGTFHYRFLFASQNPIR
eukprot:2045819-Amphidinium_carterae.1